MVSNKSRGKKKFPNYGNTPTAQQGNPRDATAPAEGQRPQTYPAKNV